MQSTATLGDFSMRGQMGRRVFISAVTGELGAQRSKIERALSGADIEVREQGKNFRQEGGTLLENIGTYIAECDTVICLIGNVSGYPPEPDELGELVQLPLYQRCLSDTGLTELSRTQWEFLLARYFQRRTLIWMTADAAETASIDTSQSVFRKWVKDLGVHREPLRDTEKLVERVLTHFVTPTSARPGEILLRLRSVANKERNRFFFAAEAVDFIGRDADIRRVKAMLDTSAGLFRWGVLHGSGGVGKSRLAHELCKQLGSQWSAGFLPERGLQHDWDAWQPTLPTFIVVDYAARLSPLPDGQDPVARMVCSLADRASGEGVPLARPVRLLLLERDNAEDWLNNTFVNSRNSLDTKFPPTMGTDFALTTIEDPTQLVAFVLEKAGKALPDRDAVAAKLSDLDPERRPLFAHLLADAILRDPEHWHALDAERLFDDVINRERNKFWKPVGVGPPEERALAFATMTGGINVATYRALTSELLPIWDIDRHPGCIAAMTGDEPDSRIPPLEPDIVGSHFVLQILSNSTERQREDLCKLAWSIAPDGMLRFTLRAHQDVPSHVALRSLLAPPTTPNAVSYWFRSVAILIDALHLKDEDFGSALIDAATARISEVRVYTLAVSTVLGDKQAGLGRRLLARRIAEAITSKPNVFEDTLFAMPFGVLVASVAIWNNSNNADITHAIYSVVATRPDLLVERALSIELGVLTGFIASAHAQGHMDIVTSMYSALGKQPELVARCAVAARGGSLGTLRTFLVMAHDHGNRSLVEAVYVALAKHSDKLAEIALEAKLRGIRSFVTTAQSQGAHDLVKTLCVELQHRADALAKLVMAEPLEQVRQFLSEVRKWGAPELLEKLWSALTLSAEAFARMLSEDAPYRVGAILSTLPKDKPEIGVAILKPFRAEEWEWGPHRNDRMSHSAASLAMIFKENNRVDLADALLRCIMLRRKPTDLGDTKHGLTELLKIVSNIPAGCHRIALSYTDLVCNPSWLDRNFLNATTFRLAANLTWVAMRQPPSIVARFWCEGLRKRSRIECDNLAAEPGPNLSAAVQFVGACGLIGHSIGGELFSSARFGGIGLLPVDVLPHRPGSASVETHQRQLWFGLREIARLAPSLLIVEPRALDQTLELWRENLRVTASDPSSNEHWVNASMVKWLAKCIAKGSGHLERSDEPLWLLTGFPEDPSEFEDRGG